METFAKPGEATARPTQRPKIAQGGKNPPESDRAMKWPKRLWPLKEVGPPAPTQGPALRACPMCHSRQIWVEPHPDSTRSFSIVCQACRFQVSLLPRAQAIAAWNELGVVD
ncbi:MAG: hypothetical protein JO069_15965 [Verrucomicrobia bacterium]|nr:hypothetical protein [Verrucomicrobiota bacterium]